MNRKALPLLILLHAAAAPAADRFLSDVRQLTFQGRRAGEGYFDSTGKRLIFQSERDPANPFYQIYLLDLETGDTRRLSPGTGKTTCAWLHPDGKRFLFASTHADPESQSLQEAEIRDRAGGRQKRYAWDYDPNFDIYSGSIDGGPLTNLTGATGYDAEASYSPDGEWIAFASNRHAWTEELSPEDRKQFEIQPSLLMDIYIMRADGSDVRRLTDVRGYDGGPFFSPDGRRICWRRFTEDESRAEVWTMNIDGSDARQITRLGAMSWAPFYHPSGHYLIFTTNRHGFDNFELYITAADGSGEPVRVTETPGFDGLPAFSPDGRTLAWTSNRTPGGTSQIFTAAWDHEAAMAALGLSDRSTPAAGRHGKPVPVPSGFSPEITAADLQRDVEYLASDALQGRMTGSEGERLATEYAAQRFREAGLLPAGDDGSYFHSFEFTAGVAPGPDNVLTVSGVDGAAPVTGRDWIPLSFSGTGETGAGPVVFAGYGLEVPGGRGDDGTPREAYSSWFHLDVKDKWVMVFRYVPEGISQEERVRFAQYSGLRYKAMAARERGAKGLLVVSGPTSKVVQQLVPMSFDASMADSGIAAVSVSDDLASSILAKAGRNLRELQEQLDSGMPQQGFEVPGVTVAARIDIHQERRTGRNVLARLPASAPSDEPALVIGAHIDHLGATRGPDSRAAGDATDLIHRGADDNASGVAALLEIAESLSHARSTGAIVPVRDIVFAGWSGEESGLLGSNAWCRAMAREKAGSENAPLNAFIAANLNMDMVGRLRNSLILQGTGSSDWWEGEIERRNAVTRLSIQTQQDCYLPTDASVFYLRRVPILNAFTGQHEDYHKPSDTPDKINYSGIEQIAKFMALVARSLATDPLEPEWREQQAPSGGSRSGFRAYLGTIPDYSQDGVSGVLLSGVSAVGPAAKAGLMPGDVIVRLAGKDIANIYDYTYVLGALKIGEETEIEVLRNGERRKMKITPGSRE